MTIHAGVKKNRKNYQPKKKPYHQPFFRFSFNSLWCLRETHGPLLRRGKLGTGNENSPLSRNLGQRLTNSNPVLHVRNTPRGVRKNSEKEKFVSLAGKSSLVCQK